MTVASVPMALARGHAAPVMRVELCSGHVVELDARGNKVPSVRCPDCIPAKLALPVGPVVLEAAVFGFVRLVAEVRAVAAVRQPAVRPNARGPPVLS